jgi:hypothetical protein
MAMPFVVPRTAMYVTVTSVKNLYDVRTTYRNAVRSNTYDDVIRSSDVQEHR